jgi:hypothetical protein
VYAIKDGAGSIEGDEQDGNVVAPAKLVCGADERFAGILEIAGIRGDELCDSVVAEFTSEAVRGEEEDVAGTEGLLADIGVYGELRAYGSGDDVTDG